MKSIKLLAVLFISAFILSGNFAFGAAKFTKKPLETETADGMIIKGTVTYPKTKLPNYPTVVLLHSFGYSSSYWGSLTAKLTEAGYATISIDLRGHGQSVYDKNFKKKYRTYLTDKDFARYPDDVIAMLNQAKKQYKKVNLNNYAIAGGDIGANTAVLVSRKYSPKPKTLVLISPMMNFKGLYIPVAMTDIGAVPILCCASTKDKRSIQEQVRLSRFAQGKFIIKNYPSGGTGMLMLKANPAMPGNITDWLKTTLK